MNKSKLRIVFGALGILGTSAGCAVEILDEEVGTHQQANSGYCSSTLATKAATNGSLDWQEKPFDGCQSSAVSSYNFGVSTDIPLIVGGELAVYGTTTTGSRRGYFFVDKDGSGSWSGGDTQAKFKSDAQAGDQPFAIAIQVQKKVGSSCVDASAIPYHEDVVGIKRGTTWYIDANGNGTWDGTASCDRLVNAFGNASDIPSPYGDAIASVRTVGTVKHWYIDTNLNFVWDAGDTDAVFGASTDQVSVAGAVGVQRGRDVFINWNSNLNYNTGDKDLINHLPSTSWKYVGVTTYFWND